MVHSASEEGMASGKTEALNRWNKHLGKCKKNSEGQTRRYMTKYLTAAKKIREGLAPRDIQRETGICPETTRRVQKMIDQGLIR
jgi:hypothetical protein